MGGSKIITPDIAAWLPLACEDKVAFHKRVAKDWWVSRRWKVMIKDREEHGKYLGRDVAGNLWREAVVRDMEDICVVMGPKMKGEMSRNGKRGENGEVGRGRNGVARLPHLRAEE